MRGESMTQRKYVLDNIASRDWNYTMFQLYAKEFADDTEVVWAAIKHKPTDIQYASERLRKNSDIMSYAIQHDSYCLHFLEPGVKIDTNIIADAIADYIERNDYFLYYLSGDIINLLLNDEIAYNVVKRDGHCLKCVSESLQDNEMIVLEAIKTYPAAIDYATRRFCEDKRLVLKAVQTNGLVLEYLGNHEDDLNWKRNREIVLEAVKQNPEAIKYAQVMDKEIALIAIRKNGEMLLHVTKELREDPEVVLEAVKQNYKVLQEASKEGLKTAFTKEIALEMVKQDGLMLEETKEFVEDKDVVLEAVKQNGNALKYVSDSFKEDFEIVLTALESLSENVKNNKYKFQNVREVYLAAIKENPEYYKYASDTMRFDKKFIIDAVRQNSMVIREVHPSDIDIDIIKNAIINDLSCLENLSGGIGVYLNNKNNVLELVKCNGMVLQYINKNYTSDYDVVLEAVKQNGMAIAYAENNLKWNQEIAMAAIKNNARAIQYTAYTLRKYKPFLLDVIEDNKYIFSYIDKDVIDYEFLLDAVKRNGMVLELYDDKLKKDKNIVLEAVKQNGLALAFAHSSLRKDLEVIEAAIANNQEAASYALRQYSPHVETIPTEQIVELPTVDEELEEIRREGNQKIGFFKQFIKKIRTNPIEEIHNEDMFKTLNAINALPEGILKETLQKDYNDLASHYFKFYKIINNKKMSEIPDLEHTELLQSINNRLSNNKQKDLEINESAKSVRSI